MTVPAEPIFFEPVYKETLWGGTALSSRFGRRLPAGRFFGESWDLVSLGADQSTVPAGALAGKTLGQLTSAAPLQLLGAIETFGKFPLLYKFIDARDRLSVQVHPDDRQARANGWGEFGKTESWYIIDAPENARVIVGFKNDVTREAVISAIEKASLHELLNFIPVKAGDQLFIPAGTVHAIMEGILLYEIQESADTTLRLYDWGRVDSAGKPRRLHVHDALNLVDTHARGDYRIRPVVLEEKRCARSFRAACRYFALEQYSFALDEQIILPAKISFRVLTLLSGGLRLKYPSGSAELRPGVTALLPAALRDVRAAGSAGTELLLSSVPDLRGEVIVPLRERGIHDAAIAQLGGPTGNDLLALL